MARKKFYISVVLKNSALQKKMILIKIIGTNVKLVFSSFGKVFLNHKAVTLLYFLFYFYFLLATL